MQILIRNFVFIVILFCGSTSNAQADLDYYLPSDVNLNKNVPTPESFFGFQPGEKFITHKQLTDYLNLLVRKSDRLKIEKYAQTFENKPLNLMIVTSPENLLNIDKIKAEHVKLSEPGVSNTLNIENMPAVVWMGYSIHGDEPSGVNSVPILAYYLAAAQDEKIEQMLAQLVILIAPSLNPDGMNRFAQWANMYASKNVNTDPNNIEHNQAWPGGRTNHYWFDLNRDYLLVQHPESRGRVNKFHEWKPNLYTDHHEMGTNSTFFFQPGIPSRNNPNSPQNVFVLTDKLAEFYSSALDSIGSTYFTKEIFDDYYYGKGSTYPDVNGGVGILFEQASSRGITQESVNGVITFPFTIRNQFTTSLATLKAMYNLRIDFLTHQRKFYQQALEDAEDSEVQAYIFGDEKDPAKNFHLVDILLHHKINIYKLKKDLSVDGKNFIDSSSYVVPVKQPQYHLIKALFEKRTQFKDSIFYDVSTWTLPLAFNMQYAELSDNYSRDLLGENITKVNLQKGELFNSKNRIAYAIKWNQYYAPKALYRLLDAGIKVRVASKSFSSVSGNTVQQFKEGTIVIPMGIQKNISILIDETINKIVNLDNVNVYGLQSSYSSAGIDLGSPSMQVIELPKIALIIGDGVSANEAGEVWHLLDRRMNMRLTMIDINDLDRVNLERYNTLLFVNGRYNKIRSKEISKISEWTKKGNTLVLFGRAIQWAAGAKLIKTKIKNPEVEEKEETFEQRAYGDRGEYRGAQAIGGSIFQVEMDLTHPVCYGYENHTLSVFKDRKVFIQPSREPYSTPVKFTENPLQSGYVSSQNLDLIKNSAAVECEKTGDGRILMMTDDPNFRAFWYGTNKLFLNTLFFGSIIN